MKALFPQIEVCLETVDLITIDEFTIFVPKRNIRDTTVPKGVIAFSRNE